MCLCQNSRLCEGDVDICDQSTGVCSVAISILNGKAHYEYACVEPVEIFGAHKADCLAGPLVDDNRSQQCCNDEDRCNEHLNPPLPFNLRTITPDQDSTTEPTSPVTGSTSGLGSVT